MNYGLTYLQGGEMAYQYAKDLDKCLEKWMNNMIILGALYPELSLRKFKNISVSRSKCLNKHNVTMFLNNYNLQRTNYTPDYIYNLDKKKRQLTKHQCHR